MAKQNQRLPGAAWVGEVASKESRKVFLHFARLPPGVVRSVDDPVGDGEAETWTDEALLYGREGDVFRGIFTDLPEPPLQDYCSSRAQPLRDVVFAGLCVGN